MAITKGRLVFISGDLPKSDQVASHTIAGGVEITATGTAMDVNLASGSGFGIYNEDAAHTTADLGQYILGVRQDADTSPVSADGDYHGLIFDNAGRLKVQADIDVKSDVADDGVDTENPLKVGSHAIDGALSAVSASGDKADLTSDMYRRIYMNDAPNVGAGYGALTVTAVAAEILGTPESGRLRIMLQNLGNKDVYLGFDGSVTTSNGMRLANGATLEVPFGEDLNIFAISETGSQDVRYWELA